MSQRQELLEFEVGIYYICSGSVVFHPPQLGEQFFGKWTDVFGIVWVELTSCYPGLKICPLNILANKATDHA